MNCTNATVTHRPRLACYFVVNVGGGQHRPSAIELDRRPKSFLNFFLLTVQSLPYIAAHLKCLSRQGVVGTSAWWEGFFGYFREKLTETALLLGLAVMIPNVLPPKSASESAAAGAFLALGQ
jgi:hypothetical protein